MYVVANSNCGRITNRTVAIVQDISIRANPIIDFYNPLGLVGIKAICKLISLYKKEMEG